MEMATDLELEPKPHHVIAFEDAADCRNLCYIIQAHLDMLRSGNVFIVPRPPKVMNLANEETLTRRVSVINSKLFSLTYTGCISRSQGEWIWCNGY